MGFPHHLPSGSRVCLPGKSLQTSPSIRETTACDKNLLSGSMFFLPLFSPHLPASEKQTPRPVLGRRLYRKTPSA